MRHRVRERAGAGELAQRGERGEVAGVVAREGGDRRAAARAARRPPCPCRPGPAAAARPPSGPRSGAASPRRAAVASAHASPRRPDRVGVRQWMVTRDLALALDQQPGRRGVRVVGGPGDGVDPRPHRVVDDHLAVDEALEAVGADVLEARRARCAPRGTSTGRPLTTATVPGPARAGRAPHVPRAGPRGRRVGDDRRERAVEVDEQRGATVGPRRTDERGRDGHDALRTARYAVPMIDDAVGVGRALGRVLRVRLRRSRRCRRRTPRAACPRARSRRGTGRRCPCVGS